MLKIFDPIIFPIAISLFFLNAATTDVTNSGNDVPAATIVRPIIFSLMPKIVATAIALSTTNLPPITRSSQSQNNQSKNFKIGKVFYRQI